MVGNFRKNNVAKKSKADICYNCQHFRWEKVLICPDGEILKLSHSNWTYALTQPEKCLNFRVNLVLNVRKQMRKVN